MSHRTDRTISPAGHPRQYSGGHPGQQPPGGQNRSSLARPPKPAVFIVDDDTSVRGALGQLFKAAGFQTFEFGSAREFLDQVHPSVPACLLLDLGLPDMSGLEVLGTLAQQDVILPTIVLTGHADVPTAVQAFKGGAFDYLEKPVGGATLVDRAREAIACHKQAREHRALRKDLAARFATLTPRERQVMQLVASGQANEPVAQRLGISIKTVEAHRTSVMRKMQAVNLVDLVRMAVLLEDDQSPRTGSRPAGSAAS